MVTGKTDFSNFSYLEGDRPSAVDSPMEENRIDGFRSPLPPPPHLLTSSPQKTNSPTLDARCTTPPIICSGTADCGIPLYNGCEDHWSWNPKDKSHEVRLNGPKSRISHFHPNWSNGTAGVRGTRILNGGRYYWEINVSQRIFGTRYVSV